MEKVLVSACLLGRPVRYNGKALAVSNAIMERWRREKRIIAACPEVDAGMSTPRQAAEISSGNGADVLRGSASVIDKKAKDVSQQFIDGAKLALKLCLENNIKIAVLTESSPSCGSTTIFNGEFSGTKIAGIGVTCALLEQHGVSVFNQFSLGKADLALRKLD